MTRLQKGDQICIRLAGSSDEWVHGAVILASDTNPSSVGVMVEGVLRSNSGAWIGGGLSLMVDYDAATIRSFIGDEYDIEVAYSPEATA